MAHATINEPVKHTITLALTDDEAAMLYAMTRNVRGDPDFTSRGLADNIRRALRDVVDRDHATTMIDQNIGWLNARAYKRNGGHGGRP